MDYSAPTIKTDEYVIEKNDLLFGDDDLQLSPFEIDWGVNLPKQTENFFEEDRNTPEINADDYVGEESIVFGVLNDNIRTATNINTSWVKRKKSLTWCFDLEAKDKKTGIGFKDACLALGARPDVMLARLQCQLFLSGIPIKEPLKAFWLAPLPEQYVSEAIMASWEEGLKLIEYIWTWPGIPMDILEAKFSDINFGETLEKLEKAGLIGWRFGCVFVIGRPENRMGKRGFSWSKSFF